MTITLPFSITPLRREMQLSRLLEVLRINAKWSG
jgi:hypothetical protein